MPITTDNYFAFYGLPVSFGIDAAALKRAFLHKSRQHHPDFYTQADGNAQEQALAMATYNNQAYETLGNTDKRVSYVLQLKGAISPDERYDLPPAFLGQMMDINEALSEIDAQQPNPQQINSIAADLDEIARQIEQTAQEAIAICDNDPENTTALKKIKEFYYKKRYLLRVQKTLLTFAPH